MNKIIFQRLSFELNSKIIIITTIINMWDILILSSALYYARSELHTNALAKIAKIRMYISIMMSLQLYLTSLFFTSRLICDIEQCLIILWVLILLPADALLFIFMSNYRVKFKYIIGGLIMFVINTFTFIIFVSSTLQSENCITGRLITKVYILIAYILVPCITSIIVVIKSNASLTKTKNPRRRIVGGIRQSIPNQEECAICLSSLEGEISTMSCKHSFHTECLNSWFQRSEKTCPLCRSNV